MTLVIKPEDIIEKISNKKTGEVYKNEEEWKTKGVPEEDIRRDVTGKKSCNLQSTWFFQINQVD